MNPFALAARNRGPADTRLERYAEMGYDIEVCDISHTSAVLKGIKIVLELKSDGYLCELYFTDRQHAERWNSGWGGSEPNDSRVTKTSTTVIAEEPFGAHVKMEKPKKEESTIPGPNRLVEID